MLLPAGISKGTGVQHALRFRGLSFHDAPAFGDAEERSAVLRGLRVAGVPGRWYARVVKEKGEQAESNFPGGERRGGGGARGVLAPPQGLLPVQFWSGIESRSAGGAETSEPVAIPARGVNVLVHGDPLSGKSWLAGVLVERLVAARYAVWVIDPEGHYQAPSRLAAVHLGHSPTASRKWCDCSAGSSGTWPLR